MSQLRAARRYAEALMMASEEQNLLENTAKDLEGLERLFKESAELQLFLKSPVVSSEKKKSVFQELFEQKVHALTMSFLTLLVEKGREGLLPEIVTQFFRLRDEKLGIVNVKISAAAELTKDQHRQIEKKFETLTQKKVRLAFSIDKMLKGGFIARVGDTMFDASVRHQLELLRERFRGGNGMN